MNNANNHTPYKSTAAKPAAHSPLRTAPACKPHACFKSKALLDPSVAVHRRASAGRNRATDAPPLRPQPGRIEVLSSRDSSADAKEKVVGKGTIEAFPKSPPHAEVCTPPLPGVTERPKSRLVDRGQNRKRQNPSR